jgi:hypothetical protein
MSVEPTLQYLALSFRSYRDIQFEHRFALNDAVL